MTFLCTVRKPEEVVEAGLHDLASSLTHYLIRHQKLFHLGEDYQLGQVTVVRHNVTLGGQGLLQRPLAPVQGTAT